MLIVKFISNTVGTWMSGIPSRMEFESGMEDEIVMNRKTIVYKIVSVIQPPFMQWNETLSKKLKSDFNINLRYYCQVQSPSPNPSQGTWGDTKITRLL